MSTNHYSPPADSKSARPTPFSFTVTPNQAAPEGLNRHISSHMIPAVLCAAFLCLPTGLAAVFYASQVNTHLDHGDIDGALQSSAKAKRMCWISLGVFLLLVLVAGS